MIDPRELKDSYNWNYLANTSGKSKNIYISFHRAHVCERSRKKSISGTIRRINYTLLVVIQLFFNTNGKSITLEIRSYYFL